MATLSASETPVDTPASAPDVSDDSTDQDCRQHSIHIAHDSPIDDFESCFSSLSIHSVHIHGINDSSPLSAETVILPSVSPRDAISVRRLAETYNNETASVYAHTDNGSMACTANYAKFLFAYRPLTTSRVYLFDAGDHVHHPLGIWFLCVPTDNRETGGAPEFVFVQTYHTPTISGVIISHSAISKQLNTLSYCMSSHLNDSGFIHFPDRLRRCQDIYVSIQPILKRGGLTISEALILPTDEQHSASIPPWPTRVHSLCSNHSSDSAVSDFIDPMDGKTCRACQHKPPAMLDSMPCHVCQLPISTPDFR
jgi:hypothetical protein